ncbi:hypothetical protein SAMN05421847_2175 [Halpernia humi]|uniref:Uncharacterized protein n=1 Tax=Halpernia humi TaxID=493375 RepID=A0A1H5ZRK8_9FLAO|nr:hypothetical protein [Halpernia humi]SEG39183.1 hypothetical protein SAMN05421847_2175 [Halpernia humi]
MENSSTYQDLDLQKVSMYDIAEVLADKPALLISPDEDLSDEQIRILGLFSYAEYYQIKELQEKIAELYKKELLSIQS